MRHVGWLGWLQRRHLGAGKRNDGLWSNSLDVSSLLHQLTLCIRQCYGWRGSRFNAWGYPLKSNSTTCTLMYLINLSVNLTVQFERRHLRETHKSAPCLPSWCHPKGWSGECRIIKWQPEIVEGHHWHTSENEDINFQLRLTWGGRSKNTLG